jgi:hypothetical protein
LLDCCESTSLGDLLLECDFDACLKVGSALKDNLLGEKVALGSKNLVCSDES